MATEGTKKWYLRKELYGTIITSLTPTLLLFPQHTLAFKIGVSLNGLAGGLLTYFGVVKGYKGKNLIGQENSNLSLPEGLRKKSSS
jgi:hypothetical protein